VTFNELVNAMVVEGQPIWGVLAEMRTAGVQPNQVTCSILLKNLNADSEEAEIVQTMDLIGAMEQPMDEVLLSSVVEACVRIGKPELLSSKLKQLRSGDGLAITGSHTFGSLIKAYGAAGDIDGVWRCWKEMRTRHVRPTSITLGCMVEAVVSNGDAEGAYELVHQMQEDEQCRKALNAVIYCSVLKGFTRAKRWERVWAVYAEMKSKGMESVVTYNTIMDACARCGHMERVAEVLNNMQQAGIAPNIITYSTMIKGHCQAGELQKAFGLLEKMRRDTNLKPDEIMYNSLIDGCSQNNLVDEGLRLFQQMQDEGVRPSNFTLSAVVKLMSRARRLDRAYDLVHETAGKYRIRPNVHVHTNLIQACIAARQLSRALSGLERMVEDRVQPNERTYAILLRACISSGLFETTVGLLRAALGLNWAPPALARKEAICSLEPGLLNQTLSVLADGCQNPEMLMDLLADIKQCKPNIRISASTQHKVTMGGVGRVSTARPLPRAAALRLPRQGRGQRPRP